MFEVQSFLGGLSWMGSFSYRIWRGKEGANIQASLLPWPTPPPPPANLSFNLSGAVPASRWGPHLDHGGSRLQGACPRPDSKGNNPHVWRPHKPGETHCHGTHVAQHILECCWGWAYPVRAWGIDGACASRCMFPSHLPTPLASTGLTPSLQQSSSLISLPRAVVCRQAQLGTFASPPLPFPILFLLLYYMQAFWPPATSGAESASSGRSHCCSHYLVFCVPSSFGIWLFLTLRSLFKSHLLRSTFSDHPKVDPSHIILCLSTLSYPI